MRPEFSSKGFALTELLVALSISSIVVAGIYSAFHSQQKSYVAQEQIAAMHQNLRGAILFMGRDIRMAGYDPTGRSTAKIETAQGNLLRITMDMTDDSGTGDPDGDTADSGEDITYSLVDVDGDGDMDLVRNDTNGVGNQQVAENIDALNFVYLDDDRLPTADPLRIRSVQVTVVARTAQRDPGYQDTRVYRNQQGETILTPPGGDSFRRKLLSEEFKCRNLGLK
ncbi:MAG: prepilin-type N-terminal cleavage/methylation domain-containing protein [Deltaproteobacteria bacterium]|nr:prepilin-type N-terminal cleavage/methylation domain-containing protein [Deltaproteobacteria bacterium]